MKSAAGTAPPPTPAGERGRLPEEPGLRRSRGPSCRKGGFGGAPALGSVLPRPEGRKRLKRARRRLLASSLFRRSGTGSGGPGGIWASGLSQQDAAAAGTAEAILGCLRTGAKAGTVLSGMRRTECNWSARFELPQAKKEGRGCNRGRDLQELGTKSWKTRTRDGRPKEDDLFREDGKTAFWFLEGIVSAPREGSGTIRLSGIFLLRARVD